jgi:molybdopterin-guanine dinucleotide biosynthesis protein
MNVIALMGPSRGGKSTIAKAVAALLQKNDMNANVLSFADELRILATEEFGWTGEKTPEQREIIQRAAETWKHEFGEDIFAQTLLAQARSDKLDTVVIDDLRHVCELVAVHQADGVITILHLAEKTAEQAWKDAFKKQLSWATHRSELEWRGFRHLYPTINNDKNSPHGIEDAVNKIVQIHQRRYNVR